MILRIFVAFMFGWLSGVMPLTLALAVTAPNLPAASVTTTYPTPITSTFTASCATFQSVLNSTATTANANPTLHYQITLGSAGDVCTGNYFLPARSAGTGWIVITGPNGGVKAAGTRVALADRASMPSLKYAASTQNAALVASTDAQRYRLVGIGLVNDGSTTVLNYRLVCIGLLSDGCGGDNTGYIIFDRVVCQDTNSSAQHVTVRCIQGDAQAGNIALIDSYCAGMGVNAVTTSGNPAESQCLQIDKNAGPILIRNNYLSAAGEQVMFGGGNEATTTAEIPQDITIQYNDFTLDAEFQNGQEAIYPDTKTLLEFKEGLRVLVEGNRFSNMYSVGLGYAMRLTARNSSAVATASQTTDLTIRYNLFHDNTALSNWLGSDVNGSGGSSGPTSQSKRWAIHDNLMYNMGTGCLGGSSTCGQVAQVSGGNMATQACFTDPDCELLDVAFYHNTYVISGTAGKIISQSSINNGAVEFRDNIIDAHSQYGIWCTDSATTSWGTACLNQGYTSWVFKNNFLAALGNGDSSGSYPNSGGNINNQYPATLASVLFTNSGSNDYTLQVGSPAKAAASDGLDMGVSNWTAYNAAQAGGGSDTTPPSVPTGVTIAGVR